MNNKIESKNPHDYEYVNHPNHYNKYDIETIDMMEKIWGTEATALWCEMTAFKYRMRLGEKPENTLQQDLNKENWYLNKSKYLKSKLNNNTENYNNTPLNSNNTSYSYDPLTAFNNYA